MRSLLVLSSLVLVAALPAQSPSSFVVPPYAAGALGGQSAGFPFSYTDYVRYQQAIDTSNFPNAALLYGMSLRVETPQTLQSVPDPAMQGIRVTLSDCANPVTSLSSTFANNVAGTPVVVFDGVVPIQKGNPSDPLEWNVTIPFTTPYLHTNLAPMLVELFPTSYQGKTCNGGGNGTSFDAVTDPSFATVLGKGPCGTGPTAGSVAGNTGFVIRFYTDAVLMPYGKACPGSNGMTTSISSSGGASSVGNPNFAVTLSGAAPSVNLGVFMLGVDQLQYASAPLPLALDGFGMPSCFLHQDLVFSLPHPILGGAAIFGFAVPPNPSLSGQSLFPQWAIVDFPANPTGVITSQGGWVLIR